MAKIVEISKKIPEKSFLPDGWYTGQQSAYTIEVFFKNEIYIVKVDEGVRGINIPVTIKIEGNNIQIEYLKN
jgi:hypothetical protein